jgi:dihydrofolate reductase
MRKLVVSEFMTLDGVVEDPGGSEKTDRGGWAFQFERGKEGDRFKEEELFASDALLLGRVTYQGFAAAWPSRTGEFANKMNTMTKVVVSTTMDRLGWDHSRLIMENVCQEVAKLKQENGGDILVAGSGCLVSTLLENNLVDELRLMVFPVILGKGKRLFQEGSVDHAFRLVEAKPVGQAGVLTLVYASRPAPSQS